MPGRWIPFSVFRKIVNPLFDRAIEHNPKLRQLVLELEQQATELRDRTVHSADSLTGENGATFPS